MHDFLGQTVGSYQITGKIAEGGMGVVYRAEHALLGRAAAVKVLLPELSSSAEVVTRFFNEARAATAIRHAGIVEIFDFGYLPSGMAFIVMELLDGEPLSRRLTQRGPFDERTALVLVRHLSSALAAAHACGIVHRDLKPDNIFLCPDADLPGGVRPKLLDFGIAKLTDAGQADASRTRTGVMMGTPTYMAPEQCRGAGEVDHRADLYAIGCVLYEMLTGRPPFVAEGVGELLSAHMLVPPEPPSRLVPSLSAHVDALVMQLLAKRPEDRVPSASALARLLGQGSAPPMAADSAVIPPTPTPTPTTLGGAAVERATAPSLTRGLWIVLASVALVVSGALAVIARPTRTRPSPSATSSPSPSPSPTPPPTPTPIASLNDAGVDAPLAPSPTPAPPTRRTPSHRTEPHHAEPRTMRPPSTSPAVPGPVDRGD
jgi:serine/threonine protein kinase